MTKLTTDGRSVPARIVQSVRTPLYRDALALVFNSGVTSLIGLAYWAEAARFASPSSIAVDGTLISAMIGVASVSQYSLGAGLVTYLPRLASGATRLVRRVYLSGALASAALGAAYVLIAPRVSRPLHDLSKMPLAFGFIAAVVIWTIFGLQDGALTGLRQAVWVPVENIAYSAVKLGLVIALASNLNGHWIFATWTVPAAVGVVPVSAVLFRRLLPARSRLQTNDAPPTVSFSRFVLADATGMTAMQLGITVLLPLLIVTKLGATKAALFFIPWVLVQSFDLLASNLGMSLTVEGASTGDVRPMLRRLMIRLLALVACLSLAAGLAAPGLMNLFGSAYGHASAQILRLLLVGSVLKVITLLALATFRAELATGKLVVLLTIPSVIVPIGAWFLMPLLGVEGPAFAVIAGQVVGVLIALRYLGWMPGDDAA